MLRATPAIPAAIACSLALTPAANAATTGTRDLWATVNVCDTAGSPNEMGVRARMPGDGRRHRMYMRFLAEFRNSKKQWEPVSGKGASSWLYAGSSLFRTQELGYTFSFDPPKAGSSYLMRGLVQFQWRSKKGAVVRRTHLATEAGHPTKGADPKNFTAASCSISTPAK
jgi:hypothetical protein